MNNSKIACEFILNRFSISYIAEKNNMSKAEVVKSIFGFLINHPNTSYKGKIKRKLKIELTKQFLASHVNTEVFSEEYGMDVTSFRKLMREVIDDYELVQSNALANKLFIKLMSGTYIKSKYVPKRIVKQICLLYVGENYLTQDDLASIYGTRRETIASIFKRGIAENIIDDVTADKIIMKVSCYNKSVEAYDLAFDERAKHKAVQS